jgi:elongation factor G
MSEASPSAIRNLVLVGQAGAGKTSLAEALLAAAGALPAPGSVEKGNTVCDHDPLERELGHSVQTALVNFEWAGHRLYLADTPGLPDFAGQSIAALAAADTALVVIDARTGVRAMTERMMRAAGERGLCRMIVVNGIDAERADLAGVVGEIRERFGSECMFLDLPARHGREVVELLSHEDGESDLDSVAGAHRALIDRLVEDDETLLARYLDEGADPTEEELHAPFEKALRDGRLIPVMFTSARTGAGVAELLHIVTTLAPSPLEANPPQFFRGGPGAPDAQSFAARPDPGAHAVAHVFRVSIDPYMGRVGAFRVFQGTVRKDMQLFVGDARRPIRVAHLYRVHGKELIEAPSLQPGEIGAIARVDELHFDAVLHDSHDEDHIHLKASVLPAPMHGLALSPRRQGDEQKLSEALARLAAEDPSMSLERDDRSHAWVIRGVGEVHLQAKLDRLARGYRLEVDTRPPRVPYRETITAQAEGHHRHRKQSGGAGQFGEVMLRVEPLERGAGFEFVDQVKGGAIPACSCPRWRKSAAGARRGSDRRLPGDRPAGRRARRQDSSGRRQGGRLHHCRPQGGDRRDPPGRAGGARADRRGGGRGAGGFDRRDHGRHLGAARPRHRHVDAGGRHRDGVRAGTARRARRLRFAAQGDDRRGRRLRPCLRALRPGAAGAAAAAGRGARDEPGRRLNGGPHALALTIAALLRARSAGRRPDAGRSALAAVPIPAALLPPGGGAADMLADRIPSWITPCPPPRRCPSPTPTNWAWRPPSSRACRTPSGRKSNSGGCPAQ